MPTMEKKSIEAIYALFKGEPGLRKSGAALSFPKPIYFFDWDMKMDALVQPMVKWGLKPSDISYDSYQNWDDARKRLEAFQIKCNYKTIVIDSITSCADAINRQTLKMKRGDDKGKMIAGIAVNSIEDFNAEESALKELVALTKDIKEFHKVNVVLIGHIIQKEQKSAEGKTHMSRILLTAGKGIAQKIPAYCSEVYHFNIQKEANVDKGSKYALLTTHTGDDFARTSLDLPTEIVFGNEPLYERWIKPAIDSYNTQIDQLTQTHSTNQSTQPTNQGK